ncbi:MAG TPA: hypothetical protein VF345_09110 [Chthoniobacterales bacterium]
MLLFACDRSDQQIKVYRIAKAPFDATPSADAAMPTNASSPSSLPESAPITTITAAVPPNWEPQPLSQMRQASFLVHGENGAVADVSFVTLGPAAGNILDNVNRWLAQLAQPPITADKLAGTIQQLPTARGDIAIVDMTGQPESGDSSKDGRIIGAIASDEGRIAFFKMRGNSVLVGAEKENFLKWVSSSRGANSTASTTDSALPPANSDKPEIKWEVPQGWSPAAASAMRYASFTSETNGEKADISVVTFAGDGGSDADNVNRWRQQIGLPAVEAGSLNSMIVPVRAGEISFSTVDMVGATARVLAGWTRHDGRTWFFKLTGPKTVVEQEKPKFVKFLQSVRF